MRWKWSTFGVDPFIMALVLDAIMNELETFGVDPFIMALVLDAIMNELEMVNFWSRSIHYGIGARCYNEI